MDATEYVLKKKKELSDSVENSSNTKTTFIILHQMFFPGTKLDRMILATPFSKADLPNKYTALIFPATKAFIYGTLAYKLLS